MTHLIEPDARVYITSYIAACGALVPRDDAEQQIAQAIVHDCPACLAVAADDLETARQFGVSEQRNPARPDIDRLADHDDSDTDAAEQEFENRDDDVDEDDVDEDDGLIDEC